MSAGEAFQQKSADVIVVGGGPAGVAAALELKARGIARVMILDREPALGGATRHCLHSPFGIREFGRVYFGPAYAQRLQRQAQDAGVDIRTGRSVVELGQDGALLVASARGVETLKARRIVLATGAREKPRSARLLPGDRPVGVVTTGTLQSYVAFHGIMPFRRPLIVGSELVSFSALLTCLTHRARPVAMIEPEPHPLARSPFQWFPRLAGVPFHCGATLTDIRGRGRVEEAYIRLADGRITTVQCDGVLLTGRFTPEAALLNASPVDVAAGSAGPLIDQDGRMPNPIFFAGGNVLRAAETGGWAFREGRRVGAAVADDLAREPCGAPGVPVTFADPLKLAVPAMLRPGGLDSPAFRDFQLRFTRRIQGRLSLHLDETEVWSKTGRWCPERRVLVPIPGAAFEASQIAFHFQETN
ncbi:pyridine nucleotide-disulfide oxidoreductase [Agrobacterium deltaense]|uniref:NAD(P)/FAD-dependent oxidoreductase n=1 Tax=Agrobacterium TaxID=357 RepID=UPI000745A4C2|nr:MULTISPECIES: FAD/NAD(P)-binding oxidoreductase [Agrobacterium]KVK39980.1 pyridine nucleotide-disulfide oxidoreductase [Agrobacterium sp. D14]RKF32156.1 pyridine nucleotide-disulfide oxidoreductase [Agrobacterium deltaense]